MKTPTPVGGTILPVDFAPSLLLVILYCSLIPLIVFRLVDKRSRCVFVLTTAGFVFERIAVYAIRTSQARSNNLTSTYLQLTFSMGFINFGNNLLLLLRVFLVNPTFGWNMYYQSPPAGDAPLTADNDDDSAHQLLANRIFPGWHRERYTGQPEAGAADHPKRRFWFRRSQELGILLFIAAMTPSGLGNNKGNNVLRYVGGALGLLFVLLISGATLWGYLALPRVRTKAFIILFTQCFLMCVIGVYRLSIYNNATNSLLSMGPHSLNSPTAKAAFYIFHALPEWFANLLMLVVNVRQLFGTGLLGDWRLVDETEDGRKRRLEKESKQGASNESL